MAHPGEPEIVAVADSILESPEGPEYAGDVIMATTENRDVPGPSTTFLPNTEHTHNTPPPATTFTAEADAAAAAPAARGPPPRAPSPTIPDLRRIPGASAADDDDDEDDEVVARLPVYLSPALHPSLAMFQYPLQHRSLRVPGWAADRGKRITTRVKESVGRVEIEVPVDADPKVWRDERARDLGYVPDINSHARENGHAEVEGGVKGKGKKAVEAKWGDKMRLRSENVPVASGLTHFSGIVHDGELQCLFGGEEITTTIALLRAAGGNVSLPTPHVAPMLTLPQALCTCTRSRVCFSSAQL